MTKAANTDWRKDFGIDGRMPPSVFTNKDELTRTMPQAHLLRRAFDVLQVDGVLCADHSPLAYFKRVDQITPDSVRELHKQFWNHAGAPILVLITDSVVHVYSGMTRPVPMASAQAELPSLVATLTRVASALKEFVVAVETGEFFRQHQPSFNPAHRVDRDLLNNLRDTRDKLDGASRKRIPAPVLDSVLCRLVFTCYLFDRDVIGEQYLIDLGVQGATHLRDILGIQPREKAKATLYRLFKKLGQDFNGDLFSDDLKAEAELIQAEHIVTLDQFFRGTTVRTGQGSFWPYDFAFIPIETISAIYERFLKASDEQAGAFYTPRFLAEVVLDTALDKTQTLLGKKFLDPACGSGIFLVGLFNRIAEEWRQANPTARNDRKSKELMGLLQDGLFGVDISETACRITAFSLYLAYLDQLSPRDIQALQQKGRALPRLVTTEDSAGNIQRADFFDPDVRFPSEVSLVIGNPPWGGIATENTLAGRWCVKHTQPLPDKQIAAAFIWKAPQHIADNGRICFVLPHGVLFNHSSTAIPFQTAWVKAHAIDRVINLADLRFLLFEKAIHPAVVVSYRSPPPTNTSHAIEYWAPKADWTVTRAEVITVAPIDRTSVTVGELLNDLSGADAPQTWKRRFWATPRDWRLLDRMSLYPRIRDNVRQTRERAEGKPWIIAQGFQPLGPGDKTEASKEIDLPSKYYIGAEAEAFNLILLPADCTQLSRPSVRVRGRSGIGGDIFRAPHVLVSRGFTKTGFSSCAYADFDVSFRSSVRGIHGPANDTDLLIFLAAYLRSSIASYYLLHTSSSLGIYRPEVHDKDLLQLPFPLPDHQPNPSRSWEIVREVARLVKDASRETSNNFMNREYEVNRASAAIEPLVNEYFDVLPMEAALVKDTIEITVPSLQPSPARMPVETVKPATTKQCEAYRDRLCKMLNGWAKGGPSIVRGRVHRSGSIGVGMTVLEKIERANASIPAQDVDASLLEALDRLRRSVPRKHLSLDLVRGVMLFDRNRLYVVKPIGQRFWTQTAAMNDADEIAGTILMRSQMEDA